MRSYIFNFSAKKVEKLGIKGTPVIILDYLDQFFKSGHSKDPVEYQNKIYYWIEASKVVEDLAYLDIKSQRVRQYFDFLCDKGVLSKYPADGPDYSKTKLRLHINYNLLVDQVDGDLNQIVGKDTTLPFYMPPNTSYYAIIKYNAFTFIYESPAIQSVLIETDKTRFNKLLHGYLQKLLSPLVYEYFKTAQITTNNTTIKLTFKATSTIVEECIYKLEQAVVGAYTSLMVAQIINKSKPTPAKTIKNEPILNQIAL